MFGLVKSPKSFLPSPEDMRLIARGSKHVSKDAWTKLGDILNHKKLPKAFDKIFLTHCG
jgi:hypothetical protein